MWVSDTAGKAMALNWDIKPPPHLFFSPVKLQWAQMRRLEIQVLGVNYPYSTEF